MSLKINQIYKVKEGHEWKCGAYKENEGTFIKITVIDIYGYLHYDIFNKKQIKVGTCCACFIEDDLELEKEVKEKSLEDLEVGDEAIKRILNRIDKMKEEARVGTGWTCDGKLMTLRFDKLINEIKDITNYNPITTFSPSEAETLLEEKLGIKVKIK